MFGCPVVDESGTGRVQGGPWFFLGAGGECLQGENPSDCAKGAGACFRRGVLGITREGEIQHLEPDIPLPYRYIEPGGLPTAGCEIYINDVAPQPLGDACDVFHQLVCARSAGGLVISSDAKSNAQLDLVLASTKAIESCVDAHAAFLGYDVRRCLTPAGTGAEETLKCVVFGEMLERIDECISAYGPQSMTSGYCFAIFRSEAYVENVVDVCEICPWWSSYECVIAATEIELGWHGN